MSRHAQGELVDGWRGGRTRDWATFRGFAGRELSRGSGQVSADPAPARANTLPAARSTVDGTGTSAVPLGKTAARGEDDCPLHY